MNSANMRLQRDAAKRRAPEAWRWPKRMNTRHAYLMGVIALSCLSLLFTHLHSIAREFIGHPFNDDTPPYYGGMFIIMMLVYGAIILLPAIFIHKRMRNRKIFNFSVVYAAILSTLLFMLPLWGVILDVPKVKIDSLLWVDVIGFFTTIFLPIVISTIIALEIASEGQHAPPEGRREARRP
jgi:hypothetical protein